MITVMMVSIVLVITALGLILLGIVPGVAELWQIFIYLIISISSRRKCRLLYAVSLTDTNRNEPNYMTVKFDIERTRSYNESFCMAKRIPSGQEGCPLSPQMAKIAIF